MRLLALLGLQQTEMTDFPYPFPILQLLNFLPFHILKKTPFPVEPLLIGVPPAT